MSAYGKEILRNEADFDRWLHETFDDMFGHDEAPAREEMRRDAPASYPAAICWKASKVAYNWFFYQYIYPSDFEDRERPLLQNVSASPKESQHT